MKKKRTILQRIVNAFLYTGIGLLFLLLILFGISQTSTFREFLRETIVEEANSALNGKLYIEEIEGTIFTSLILHNTVVSMGKDTLFKAETIGVMTSPLQLLLKKIHIRHFEIQNASINLSTDESGELNLTKLFPPSEEDTTESEFPFVIQIANLQLENVNLSFKDYSIKTPSTYDSFNFNDIQLKNLNLNLAAKLDINDNIYELSLDHLSFKPNVNNFSVNEFEGEFFINEKGILAEDLFLKTDRSELKIKASATDINIFDTLDIKPENANLNLQASSNGFSVEDIRVFEPSLNIKGRIEFGIIASGTTEQLNISDLIISLENSKVAGTAELKNLLDENLFVSADLSGSYVDQYDIKNLLAGMEIPVYPELGLIEFKTLTYSGDPLEFKSEINILTDKGSVEGVVNLNLKNEPIQYEITLNTNEVDIEPFAGVKSSLNISAEINGKGVSPETFDGSVRLFANGSSVNGNKIDTLKLTADADNKLINYDFHLVSNKTVADLNGNFDFNPEEATFKVKGNVRDLNLAEFVQDTALQSDINITLDGEGNGFSQDSLDLFLIATLYNSNFSYVEIDTTRLIVDLRSPSGEDRVINIVSDLADVTIMGDYKVDQAIDLIVSEVSLLSSAFNEKINDIIPSIINEDEKEIKAGLKINKPLFTQVDEPISFNYLIDLKDFSLVSAFMDNYELEIDAEMGGRFESTPNDSVLFTFETEMRYIKVYSDSEAYFISNMELDLEVQNSFNASSTSDLILDLNTTADWIFAGSHIYDLTLNLNMEKDVANVKLSVKPDPFSARLTTEIDLSHNNLDVSIDSLRFIYSNFTIENRNDLNLTYDGNRLDVNQFKLIHNNSELNIKGYLSQTGNQNLDINLYDLKGKDLSVNLLKIKPENSVEASINLNAHITGSFNSPIINADLLIDSITYGNKTFGELKSIFKYNNKNLDINLAFLDSTLNKNDTALTIRGDVPIDLSFAGAEENYMETKPMNIFLRSDGFSLGAFGDILPAVNKLRGEFTSDLKLTGTPSLLRTEGYLKIKDAAFFLEANNLEYNVSLLVNIDGENLTLDSLVISNVPGTENGGKIFGSGTATLDNFNINSSGFSLNGDLKVLSEASKSASPSVYGELVIGIEDKAEIKLEENRLYVQAPILIKAADLTFPQTQSAYQSGSENYIYKYPEETVSPDSSNKEMDFDKLVDISEKRSESTEMSKTKTSIIDYDIKVTIEDEATFTYILSKEFNQNLVAVLDGSIRVEKSGSRIETQGKLKLLEGSTLQFLKTLDAKGSIEFLSGELTNPNLDIVATYRGYYYPAEGADAGEEVPVEVRLFIKGPLKDLSKRLVSDEDNLKVYYGAQSIADNTPSPIYDASDAVMFILRDEFYKNDDQQKGNEIASVAASFAGSLVGGFLNEQFGDAIKTVQLRQVGTATVISLVGRAGDFRYEIGTSTDVYQDLSRANVKIQYPVTRKLFLRLERKESINRESTYTNEMINEVGIKYIFEF